ncbi:MAG: hypothetical protein E6G19_04455 [Actinobacteria bacterium]|nr:MAG: hypothetical protein E6G19_04455 [Actinomycetota bacterium]
MAEPTEAQRKRSQGRERRRSQAAAAENRAGDGVVEESEEPLEAVKHAAKVAAAGAAVGAAAAAARALTSRSDDEHESEPAAEAEEAPAAEQESQKGEPGPRNDEPAAEAEEASQTEQESPEPEPSPRRAKASERAPAAFAADGDESEEPVRGASPDEATQTVERARRQLSALLAHPVESVSAFERTHDGWLVTLEVVEVSRIPESTDVLASYEVELDEDRNLRRYARVRRYVRSQADRGDQQ